MPHRMVPSSQKAPKGILKGVAAAAPAIPVDALYQRSPKADPALRLLISNVVDYGPLVDMSAVAISSRTTWLGNSGVYGCRVGRVLLDNVEYYGLIPPDRLDRGFVLPETSVLSAEFPDAGPTVIDVDGVTYPVIIEDLPLIPGANMFLRRREYPSALMRDLDLELIADVIVYYCDGREPQRMWLNIPVLNAVLNDYGKNYPGALTESGLINWDGVLTYLEEHYSLPNRLWLLAADHVPENCHGYQAILAEFYRQDQAAQCSSLASTLVTASALDFAVGAAVAPMMGDLAMSASGAVACGKRKRGGDDSSFESSLGAPLGFSVKSAASSLGCSASGSPLPDLIFSLDPSLGGAASLCFFREPPKPPKISRDPLAIASLQHDGD